MTPATGSQDPTGPFDAPGSWTTQPPAPTVPATDTGTDASPAGVEAGAQPAGRTHLATAAPARRRPWGVIVLAILLALAVALSTYLWVRTVRFEHYADGIEAQARQIGSDLTQLRTEHDGTVGELAAVTDQLSTAQQRISELADEKAQLGDDRAVQQQLADYQQRVSKAAANVASALSTCIDGQKQLITYLGDAAAYDPTELATFRDQVTKVCGAATDANTELQRELSAGAGG